MLTIHHLEKSQSERVVWLCEELGLPYRLQRHLRDKVTILASAEFKALHPQGTAPIIVDGEVVLAESAAIIEYILAKYGGGRLTVGPGDPGFADYLYWLHFANGTLQPNMGRNMVLRRLELTPDHPIMSAQRGRLDHALGLIETRLGRTDYLAGSELTAADIMTVFSLTTMRIFLPLEFGPYPNIRAYLQRIGARPAYRRAMAAGDPDLKPLLT